MTVERNRCERKLEIAFIIDRKKWMGDRLREGERGCKVIKEQVIEKEKGGGAI